MESQRPPLPKTPRGEHVRRLAKTVLAGMSGVPLVGIVSGPVAELLDWVVIPVLSKRRDTWFQDVANDLDTLKERIDGFTIESLVENE